MANTLEYILTLKDQISGKLTKIGIANDQQRDKWAKVQSQVNAASGTMKNMGVTIGSLKERISALRAEKEWIPSKNINAIRRSNVEIKKLEKQVQRLENVNGGKLKKWFADLKNSVPMVNMITNPLVLLGASIYKVSSYIRESRGNWQQEAEAQQKLRAVMRNTMGASQEQVKSILDLASAQQKVGVIGDEVQIAGSQELSTYLQKTSSLKKLMPVMNDMLAQQYGYNATQEQATNIAMMMGKVMDGQVGALSRYGYKFTEAQEKILKFGTEEQRAATLADVISSAVGGVNEALAQTPEGKLKQHSNTMSDLKERVGSLFTQMQIALLPLFEKIGRAFENLIIWFEKNSEIIKGVIGAIANGIARAFIIISNIVGGVINTFSFLWQKFQEGNPIILLITGIIGSLAVSIGILTLKTKLMALWEGITTTATWLWAAAQNSLNLSLLANPITWIIAGIVALIGVIAYVCYKIEGWGTLWRGTIGFMKYTFLAYVESIKLYFNTMINGILTGIDIIKLAWYKFKEAIGIGYSAENQSAIAKINSDVEKRQKAIIDGAKKVADNAKKAKDSLESIQMSWNSDKKLSDITGKIKSSLGLGTTNEQMMANVNADSNIGGGGLSSGETASSNISSGGSRSTNITITMKNLVENIAIGGGLKEKKKELTDEVLEALIRVINMGQSTVG